MVLIQEIFKMFMNQSSLRTLDFHSNSILDFYSCPHFIQNIPFTTYLGTMDCLRNLSEFHGDSDISYEFLHQLSQACHRIRALSIFREDGRGVSNGWSNLISTQRNLKYLYISD